MPYVPSRWCLRDRVNTLCFRPLTFKLPVGSTGSYTVSMVPGQLTPVSKPGCSVPLRDPSPGGLSWHSRLLGGCSRERQDPSRAGEGAALAGGAQCGREEWSWGGETGGPEGCGIEASLHCLLLEEAHPWWFTDVN
jgi:hypothetical protein